MSEYWSQQPLPQEGPNQTSNPEEYLQHQYGQLSHGYQHDAQQSQYPPYGQPQAGQHQQAYPQHPVQPYKQQIARPSPPTCYNCGSPEHWAQDCPEQRREIPAGDLARQYAARPGKKFRPNYIPPVVTKYPVPPHVHQIYRSAPVYGGQPYPQQGYPPYQAPYGQQMPVSAQSAGYPHSSQWPGPYPQQAPHGTYQRRNTYPQQPYIGHGSPTAVSLGQYHQSPVSAYGSHHQHPGFHPPYGSGEQLQGPQHSLYTDGNPGPDGPLVNTTGLQAGYNGEMRDGSWSQSRSVTSQPITLGFQQDVKIIESKEGDNLAMLDIPDLPTHRGRYGTDDVRLVKYPLPADFGGLDASGQPLPFPSPKSGGFVKSKYLSSGTFETSLGIIDHGDGEKTKSAEPVFSFVDVESTVVPLDILRESHGRNTTGELELALANTDPSFRASRHESASTNSRDHEQGFESKDGNLRDSVSNIPRASKYQSDTQRVFQPRDAEDRLAALGVTVSVRAPARRYPPPSTRSPPRDVLASPPIHQNIDYHRHYSDTDSRSRSRSPRAHKLSNGRETRRRSNSLPFSDRRTPTYEKSHTPPIRVDRTPPYNQSGLKSRATVDHDPFDPEDKDPDELAYANQAHSHRVQYDQHNPPPPPPSPPPKRRRLSNYGIARNDQPGFEPNRQYNTYHTDRPDSRQLAGSPTKHTPEKSNHRKRDRDYRNSSDDERSTERRRQHDDVTPKLKRRQPDVPEAYSRRW